ncbi:threonine/homoserine/homoserine lactone efflux protein [Clostridium tetanomorphum]|nr:LysE family transporter [Clostridium tetanomorphum]MBP1864117.1 threonine/homoserine/homoserine lactone efflux protein [Clostridium tetanomorphum]NRS84530.1 threonine/homoserine/homoserine lactone efflux protein [Clostridium tetanomorphum]
MLLQLAVGPVCIFIFQIATLNGFYIAEKGVFGVVIVDSLFILGAILGIAKIIEKDNVKLGLKIFGASILFIFGFSIILGVFNIKLIPNLSMMNSYNTNSSFMKGVLLTISNPLTIIFWAGVFSSKIVNENMKRKDIYVFGAGAVLSTLSFLTLIAVTGSFTKTFLSVQAMNILNIIVGALLIYFSMKMIRKN